MLFVFFSYVIVIASTICNHLKSNSPKTGFKNMLFLNENTFITITRVSYLIHNRTLEHILHSTNICSSSSKTYIFLLSYKATIPEDGYVVVQNGVLVAWWFQSQLDPLLLL
jgi:hypothetical protein